MPDKESRFRVLIEYAQQGDPAQIEQGLKRVQDAAKQAGETTGGIVPHVNKLEESNRKLVTTSKELEGSLRSASDATYLFGMGAMYTGMPMLNFIANAGNMLNGTLMMAEGFGKLAANVPVLALSATTIAVTGLATAMIATANVADSLITKFRTLSAVSGQSTSSTAAMVNTLSGAMGQQGATSYIAALSGGTMTASPQNMMMELARQGQAYNPFVPDVFARYGLSRFAAGSTPMNPIPMNQNQFTISLMNEMLGASSTRRAQMLSQLGPQLGGTEGLTSMYHYFEQGHAHGLTTEQIMAQLQAQGKHGFTPTKQGVNAQQNLANAQHNFGTASSGFLGRLGEPFLPSLAGIYNTGADFLSGQLGMGLFNPGLAMAPLEWLYGSMTQPMGLGFGGLNLGGTINGVSGGIFNFLSGLGRGAVSAISGASGATSGTNGALTSPLGALGMLGLGGNQNPNQSMNTFSQSTLPNLQNMLNTINPTIQQFWQTFQNIGPTIDRVGNSAIQDQNPIIGIAAAFSNLLTGLTGIDFRGWMNTIGQWGSALVTDFNNVKTTVTDFIQNSLDPLIAAAGKDISIAVSAAINWVSQEASAIWTWLQNVPASIGTTVNLGLGWIGSEAQKVISWLESVPGAFSMAVNLGLSWIGTDAQKVISWLESVPGSVDMLVNTAIAWADGTSQTVINWLIGIPSLLQTMVTIGAQWISSNAGTVIDWLITIPGTVSTTVNIGAAWLSANVGTVIGWLMTIPGTISTAVNIGLTWLSNQAQTIITWLQNIPASVLSTINIGLGWLESTAQNVVNWVMGLPATLGATINVAFTGISGWIQNVLNFLMGLPATLGINLNIGSSTSGIPGYATGGIVMGPQLATVGEAGPEAIIPLSQMGKMGSYNVQVNVSGMDFSDPVAMQQMANAIGNTIVQNVRVANGSLKVV